MKQLHLIQNQFSIKIKKEKMKLIKNDDIDPNKAEYSALAMASCRVQLLSLFLHKISDQNLKEFDIEIDKKEINLNFDKKFARQLIYMAICLKYKNKELFYDLNIHDDAKLALGVLLSNDSMEINCTTVARDVFPEIFK